jgi:glycosyltransferase involved in cell wall biosynthesis
VSGPFFSIVTPVYDPPVDVLRDTVASVLAQDFDDWELILVDDCSPNPEVRPALAELAASDPRIRVIERETNGHIVAASNDGVSAAEGEFIALLDHDDLLVDVALSRMAKAIAKHPEADYLYSDEDKVDGEGNFYDTFRKPTWSPERQRGQNYTSHLSVLRTEVVRAVGGFHEGYDGSQDHDLVLRVTERARKVVHVPEVLYHWRTVAGSVASDVNAKPYAAIAGERAVQHHLDRLGIDAEVGQGPVSGLYTISRRLDPARRVSIVIPTMGSSGLVWGVRRVFVVEAVRSLLAHTEHENLEVVVVYDEPTPDAVMAELRELLGDRLVPVLSTEKKFNFSRKMNLGVVRASGDRIVLLNDDVEVRSDRWLEELVAPLDEPSVGMTGAKLYFSNDTIQHVGHRYAGGHYHHIAFNQPRSYLGEFGGCAINREVSGVTAACAALTRETYERVGGFSEALPVNFNDVDLSYKVHRRLGLRIVVVAQVELFHFESQTREARVEDWERRTVVQRWGRPGLDAYAPSVETRERAF